MLITPATLANLFTGFKANFNTGFREAAPVWDKIATLVPSATSMEDYGWMGQFPQLREWVGDRFLKSIAGVKYTLVNKDYESTIEVSRTKIEDDQLGLFAPLFAEMGWAAATHPDSLVVPLLANGFTTRCYDGQYFFDTNHPVGSGLVSNNMGGAGTAWFLLDTSRPLKPLIWQKRKDYKFVSMTRDDDESVFMRNTFRYGVDARGVAGYGFWQSAVASKQTLDSAGYAAARAALMAFKSDEGRPISASPKLLLVVPPSLDKAARDIVKAETLATGGTNTMFGTADVLTTAYL